MPVLRLAPALILAACTSGRASPTQTTPPAVAAVTIEAPRTVLGLGASMRLVATPRDVSGAALPGRRVTWTSSDPALVRVDDAGTVTAMAAGGTATVSAAVDGRKASAAIRTEVYHNDFDDDPLGTVSAQLIRETWRRPPFVNGVAEGLVSIVEGSDAWRGRSLRVRYPKGSESGNATNKGMSQWLLPLPGAYDTLYASYRLRFGPGFDFVRGGKIPGLGGGTNNTGGEKPNGTDGWTARMMWRTRGEAVQYVYHPDQPTQYAQDFPYRLDGSAVRFVPGQWYRVEHQIIMNTPGRHDGVVRAWVDGRLALEVTTLRFRDVASLRIDTFLFSTFFGGSGAEWAATRDEHAYFDDFVISTRRITAAP